MIKTLIFSSFLLGACCSSYAQGTPEINGYKIESVAISIGDNQSYSNSLSRESWKRLAPEAYLADSVYTGNSYHSRYSQTMVNLRATLGKSSRNQTKKFRTTYRIGLGIGGNAPLMGGYSQTEKYQVDTLVSVKTGEKYYVDSIVDHIYSLNYLSRVTTLDLGIQLNTDQSKRWSAFGGFTVNIGTTSGRAIYEGNSYAYLKNDYPDSQAGYTYYHAEGTESNKEVYKKTTSIAFGLSLPLGIQFRLAKTHPTFSKVKLFGEFRPGIIVEQIGGYGSVTSSFVAKSFGVQVEL